MSNFQDPPPPCLSTSKILPPLDLGRPISKETTPLQMITKQLKENIIQEWLLYVSRSFLQVGFRLQYQLINLAWLFFEFFSFSGSLTFCRFILLCVQLPKQCYEIAQTMLRNVFYLWLFIFLVLILQSACFICTTWKRKQTIEQ